MPRVLDFPSSILRLSEDYKILNANINEKNKLNVEKSKLELIRLIERNLKRDLGLLQNAVDFDVRDNPEVSNKYYKKILYYILAILGVINDAVRNYLFGSTLIALIPNLSQPVRIVLGVFGFVFEALLFYGFEIALLRDALEVSHIRTNLHEYINTNIEQVRAITRINRLLGNIQVLALDDEVYRNYQSVVAVLNDNLHSKFNSLQRYNESFSKKLLKAAVLGFGITTNIASSYFMINTVLATWAAALLGTPIGWGIIVLAVLVELGFYYAMGATGIIRLMNSNYNNFNQLQNELGAFHKEHASFFSKHLKKSSCNIKPRVLCEAGTQTDDSFLCSMHYNWE